MTFELSDSLGILLGFAANTIVHHHALHYPVWMWQIASLLLPAFALWLLVLERSLFEEPTGSLGFASLATLQLNGDSELAVKQALHANFQFSKAPGVSGTEREADLEKYISDSLREYRQPDQLQIKDVSSRDRTVVPDPSRGRRHPAQAAIIVLRVMNVCFPLGEFAYFSNIKCFPDSRYARTQATIIALFVFLEVIALFLIFVFVPQSPGITLAKIDNSLTRVLSTELDADMNIKEGKASNQEKEYSILGTCAVSRQSTTHVQPSYLVSFTCACGTRITDRYTELKPGGIAELQSDLQNQRLRARRSILGMVYESISAILWCPTSHRLVDVNGTMTFAPAGHVVYPAKASLPNQPLSTGRGRYTYTTSTSTNHPSNNPLSRDSILSGTTNPKTATTLASNDLQSTILPSLLLCFPKHKSGFKLHYEELPENIVRNDRELFERLRQTYLKRRNLITLPMGLKEVTKLSFTAFDVDLNNYVDLKPHFSTCGTPMAPSCVLPPPNLLQSPNAEYSYEPVLQDYCPPRGSEYMAHYFKHPEELHEKQQYLLNQIPKHLRGQLSAALDAPVRGWGLSFEEGLNYWPLITLMLIPPLVFGIVWSICKRDIQSGFGVAAYCLAAETIVLMYLLSPTAKT